MQMHAARSNRVTPAYARSLLFPPPLPQLMCCTWNIVIYRATGPRMCYFGSNCRKIGCPYDHPGNDDVLATSLRQASLQCFTVKSSANIRLHTVEHCLDWRCPKPRTPTFTTCHRHFCTFRECISLYQRCVPFADACCPGPPTFDQDMKKVSYVISERFGEGLRDK
jgi:hypothetical protein